MSGNNKKIEEVEKRLQFTVVLGIFFIVIIEALFNLSNTELSQIASVILKSGLLVAILIANYLIFEIRKEYLSKRVLEYISYCYYWTIFCYGCVFLFLGLVADDKAGAINCVTEFGYGFILVGSIYIPVISIVILLIDFIIYEIKK